ncbi:MAG: replicative DNA helicase [Alphaproteobacteria bacterium]|nr:MAG: replicative DNA helicase [Alphaproteobacteria bacterium]
MSEVEKVNNFLTAGVNAKTIPHNLEAEQALLSALLRNNTIYERVGDILQPESFSESFHGEMYRAIRHLIEKGHVADPITLNKYLAENLTEEDAEGSVRRFLINLVENVVSIVNAEEYARVIRDSYLRRQLIDVGETMVNKARSFTIEEGAVQLIEQTEHKLFELATSGDSERSAVTFHAALIEAINTAEIAYKRDGSVVGVTTGLRDIDQMLGGLHPSDLIILAGRPSMGKTALATNFAFNAARSALRAHADQSAGVAFFSLEMSAEQLATRLLGQEAKISSDKIRRGALRNEDFPNFVRVSRELAGLPLFIDDTPALSISALRTRARRLKRKHNIGMVVVDYLQLLHGGGSKSDNRVQELSEITRGLKAIAKELNVPVLALSQLSRAVEQRDDKRPQLSDLRESGSIEQDADVVMFVYREEYYESRKEPPEGTEKHREWQARMEAVFKKAEVIVAKQRHGPIGIVKVHFEGSLTKFSDLADSDKLPSPY